MLSTLCQSAAPVRMIASWAGKTPEFFGMIVKAIMMILEIVRRTLHGLAAHCRKAGRRLMALRPRLSRLTMLSRKAHVHSCPAQPDDAAGCALLADIGDGPARITGKAGPLSALSPCAQMLRKGSQVSKSQTSNTGSRPLSSAT